jgi:hypothetical protein
MKAGIDNAWGITDVMPDCGNGECFGIRIGK